MKLSLPESKIKVIVLPERKMFQLSYTILADTFYLIPRTQNEYCVPAYTYGYSTLQRDMARKRTMCIYQGFWPPLKLKIKSVFTILSLDCFIRRMTRVFTSHIDLTLSIAMVTENGHHNRLK